MKKCVVLSLVISMFILLVVPAAAYFALSLDCADTDEYEYSENAFYYPEMNVVLDYDPDAQMYYFYDMEYQMRVYVPDYVPEWVTE